jgi:hypothetical protein
LQQKKKNEVILEVKIKDMKTGFFQSISGNNSSSRLIAFIVIIYALVESSAVIYFGRSDIAASALASGSLFFAKAGSAMAFMFLQKKTELKQEKNETPNQN